ncbi:outer membrane lipoprotein chaperone LolA [Azohydromonas lata]|uniref:Outer-membrane lipoprotein carrier protein n=1 Tax=Azohydromonas lata TaxID=45677 RepID=A0ABU5IQZ8_9BURK|nr:outer membrane lipoprotein chaperone LolA [Azohydromonas lata]MDZ5461314.1 outer membrane lipoprotein chaperone LolA [Azohydromonas lata]
MSKRAVTALGRLVKPLATAALLLAAAGAARADALESLRDFVREAKTGRAAFTQTVTSPDGAKKKASSGNFEFSRPNRFRFEYLKPYEQLIVGDGQKVWIFDADLQQASSRPLAQALGSTPAALLAGGSLDKDFNLSNLPASQGLEWVQALPRDKESAFQSLRVGFKGRALAAIEIVDSFGQHSRLDFNDLATNVSVAPEDFKFVPPKGVAVVE